MENIEEVWSMKSLKQLMLSLTRINVFYFAALRLIHLWAYLGKTAHRAENKPQNFVCAEKIFSQGL